MNESMAGVQTLAIDLAETVFQLAGENDRFEVVYEARLTSRKAFYDFLRTLLAPLVVPMETGPGAGLGTAAA